MIALDRWQALSAEQRRGFAPLCPDLVAELASRSDKGLRGIAHLRRMMDVYQRNGARLGWLLLPEQRAGEAEQAPLIINSCCSTRPPLPAALLACYAHSGSTQSPQPARSARR